MCKASSVNSVFSPNCIRLLFRRAHHVLVFILTYHAKSTNTKWKYISLGDIAYDMVVNNSRVGDKFMRLIEPVASKLPYMVCPGNHENSL